MSKNSVTAIVLTFGKTEHLTNAIDSILNQTILPDRIIIADASGNSSNNGVKNIFKGVESAVKSYRLPTLVSLVTHKCDTINQLIFKSLNNEQLPVNTKWLWVLHDDTVADQKSLEAQLLEAVNSKNVALIGGKQVDAKSGELLNVGLTSTYTHRRVSKVGVGEIDQNQYDSREDVYAVSINGCLVDREVFIKLKGFNDALFKADDSLDFGRRVHLYGKRVVVATGASYRHFHTSFNDEQNNSYSVYRSRTIFRLSNINLCFLIPCWFIVLIGSIFAYIVAIYRAKGYSFKVLKGSFVGLFSFKKIYHSRRMVIKKSSRLTLIPLYISFSNIRKIRHDRKMEKSFKIWEKYSPNLLQIGEIKAIRKKRMISFLLLVTSCIAITILRFFNDFATVFARGHFVGSDLTSSYANSSELWNSSTSYYTNLGFGSNAPTDGIMLILNVLNLPFNNVSLTITVIILLSIIFAAVSMFYSSGVFTRNNTGRVLASLFYCLNPIFVKILNSGNVGNICGYLIMPIFVCFFIKAIGKSKTDLNLGEPSFKNYFAFCGILGSILVLCAPIMLVMILLLFVFWGFKYKRFFFSLIPVITINFYLFMFIVLNLQLGSLKIFLNNLNLLYASIVYIFIIAALLFMTQRTKFKAKQMFYYIFCSFICLMMVIGSFVYTSFLQKTSPHLYATNQTSIPLIANKMNDKVSHTLYLKVVNSNEIQYSVVEGLSNDYIYTSSATHILNDAQNNNNAKDIELKNVVVNILENNDNKIIDRLAKIGIDSIYLDRGDLSNNASDKISNIIDSLDNNNRVIEGDNTGFWHFDQKVVWDNSDYLKALNFVGRYLFILVNLIVFGLFTVLSLPFGIRKVIKVES